MSICQNCGTHFITSALCTGCRPLPAPAPPSPSPALPAAAPVAAVTPATPVEYVAAQKLPLVWQEKFAAIEQAGGLALPALAQLPLAARWRLRFNIFALLFGVLYYVCKGMWKRGISLALLMIALAVLALYVLGQAGVPEAAANNLATAASALVFAYRANIDYYKFAALGDDSWW